MAAVLIFELLQQPVFNRYFYACAKASFALSHFDNNTHFRSICNI
jgi:hypothetical protein